MNVIARDAKLCLLDSSGTRCIVLLNVPRGSITREEGKVSWSTRGNITFEMPRRLSPRLVSGLKSTVKKSWKRSVNSTQLYRRRSEEDILIVEKYPQRHGLKITLSACDSSYRGGFVDCAALRESVAKLNGLQECHSLDGDVDIAGSRLLSKLSAKITVFPLVVAGQIGRRISSLLAVLVIQRSAIRQLESF
jgi:hypothetical protein